MADFARLAHILSVRRETWRLRVEAWTREYEAAAEEAYAFGLAPPLHAAPVAVWTNAEVARQRRLSEIETRRARALEGMASAALRLRRVTAMARAAERRAWQRAVETAAQADLRQAADVEAWHAARIGQVRRGRMM